MSRPELVPLAMPKCIEALEEFAARGADDINAEIDAVEREIEAKRVEIFDLETKAEKLRDKRLTRANAWRL